MRPEEDTLRNALYVLEAAFDVYFIERSVILLARK